MDIIFLHNLRIETIIGVFEWERHVKQTLVFDIDIGMDNRKAAAFPGCLYSTSASTT